MTPDWAAVASALRERLTERGMTPGELAEVANVSPTTVRELMQNTSARNRQPRTMTALSVALGWPPDHLRNVLRQDTDDQIRTMREQLDELRARLDAMERADAAMGELNKLHASVEQRLDALDTGDGTAAPR